MSLILVLLESSYSISSGTSYSVKCCDLKVIGSLYSRVLVLVFFMNLSEDEASLQKHKKKAITVCK